MDRVVADQSSDQGFVSINRYGDAIRLSVKLLFYGFVYQSALSLNYRDTVIKYWMITFCALMFYAYYENTVENASIAKKMLGFVLVEQMLAQNMKVLTFGEAEDVLTRFDIEWERISGNAFFQKLDVETIMKAAQNSCPEGLEFTSGRVPKLSIVNETILRNCKLGLPMILTSAAIRDRLLSFRSFIKRQKNLSAKAILNYLLFAFAGFTVTLGTIAIKSLYTLLASVAVTLKTTIQKIWVQIKNFLTGHSPDDPSQHLFVLVNPNDVEQIGPNQYVYKEKQFEKQFDIKTPGFTNFADTESELFEVTYEVQPDKSTKQILHKIVRGLIFNADKKKLSISLTDTNSKLNEKLYDAFAQTESFVTDLQNSFRERLKNSASLKQYVRENFWYIVTFDDQQKKVELIPYLSENPEDIEKTQKIQPIFNFVTVVENRKLTPRPFPLWLVQNFPTEGVNTELSCKKENLLISVEKIWQYFHVDTETFKIVTKPTKMAPEQIPGTTLIVEYCPNTPYNILELNWTKNQKRFKDVVNVENRQFNDALDQYVADQIKQNGNLLDFVLAMIIDDFNLGVNITQNDKNYVQKKFPRLTNNLTRFQLQYFEDDIARTILMNFVRPNVFKYNKLSIAVLQNSKLTNEKFLSKMFELRNTREEKRKMTKEQTSVLSQIVKHDQELEKFVAELLNLDFTNKGSEVTPFQNNAITAQIDGMNLQKYQSIQQAEREIEQTIPMWNVFGIKIEKGVIPQSDNFQVHKYLQFGDTMYSVVNNPQQKGLALPADPKTVYDLSLLYFESFRPSCYYDYCNFEAYLQNLFKANSLRSFLMQGHNQSNQSKIVQLYNTVEQLVDNSSNPVVQNFTKYVRQENFLSKVLEQVYYRKTGANALSNLLQVTPVLTMEKFKNLSENFTIRDNSIIRLANRLQIVDTNKLIPKPRGSKTKMQCIQLYNGTCIVVPFNPFVEEMSNNQAIVNHVTNFLKTVFNKYDNMDNKFKLDNALTGAQILALAGLFEFDPKSFLNHVDEQGDGFPIVSNEIVNVMILNKTQNQLNTLRTQIKDMDNADLRNLGLILREECVLQKQHLLLANWEKYQDNNSLVQKQIVKKSETKSYSQGVDVQKNKQEIIFKKYLHEGKELIWNGAMAAYFAPHIIKGFGGVGMAGGAAIAIAGAVHMLYYSDTVQSYYITRTFASQAKF